MIHPHVTVLADRQITRHTIRDRAAARPAAAGPARPHIVCLCGSTRFSEAFRQANLRETLAGNIVLTIGCDMRADAELFASTTPAELAQIKAGLDALHRHKIKLADSVLILNVGGYIGESTRAEITYARQLGKPIRFLEDPPPAA
jgi:hypothetical protein